MLFQEIGKQNLVSCFLLDIKFEGIKLIKPNCDLFLSHPENLIETSCDLWVKKISQIGFLNFKFFKFYRKPNLQ